MQNGTIYEVGVVAALAELHHGVEQVGDVAVAVRPEAEKTEVPLQNGTIILLLDISQLNLFGNVFIAVKTSKIHFSFKQICETAEIKRLFWGL